MATNIILATMVFVHIIFIIAVIKKNFSLIDIGWGLGFILISVIAYLHHSPNMKNILLLILVSAWGLRLALHIFIRSLGKPEDRRYAKFRKDWEPRPNLNAWIKVFLFQGFLMMIVSLPVIVGMNQENQVMNYIHYLGVLFWVIGFSFEVASDLYLNKWKSKKENKGKICTTGPWSISRFPNYFGEILLWYGVYLVTFDIKTSWTIIGPVTIHILILKVTGVPLIEEHYKGRADYEEYARRVPRLIPFTHVGD